MISNGFFGLVKTSSGVDFFKHGETVDEVLEFLATGSGSQALFVGIIDLSTLEIVHVGDKFRSNEHSARDLVLEALDNAKKN